jgi:glutaredoxin-related protein
MHMSVVPTMPGCGFGATAIRISSANQRVSSSADR